MDYNSYGGNICFCRKCNGIIYVVKKDDTLYSISKQYGVTVNDILNANRYINIYNLQIGDRLCIPVLRPRSADNSFTGNMTDNGAGMSNMNSMNNMNVTGSRDMNGENCDNAVNQGNIGNRGYSDNYDVYTEEYGMDYAVNGAFESNEIEVSAGVTSENKMKLRDLIDNSDMTMDEFIKQVSAYMK